MSVVWPSKGPRVAGVLGAKIRAARIAAGLSQKELAEELGVTQAAVSQWERGLVEPGIGHFLHMVGLLGLSLLELEDKPADHNGDAAGLDDQDRQDGTQEKRVARRVQPQRRSADRPVAGRADERGSGSGERPVWRR